jgi:hypothetical protein
VTNDAADFLPFCAQSAGGRIFFGVAKYLRGPFVYQGGKPERGPPRPPLSRQICRFRVFACLPFTDVADDSRPRAFFPAVPRRLPRPPRRPPPRLCPTLPPPAALCDVAGWLVLGVHRRPPNVDISLGRSAARGCCSRCCLRRRSRSDRTRSTIPRPSTLSDRADQLSVPAG